jgi:beta-N-acetylhexosaminidase
MFTVHGTSLSGAERDVIKNHHLGSVILFAHNYDNRTQLDALNSQIQRAVRSGSSRGIGALISADQEGGVVKRFPDMPPYYSHPQLGTQPKEASYDQGRKTGRALRAAGVNVDLAPVADLDEGPAHVMSSRSFGSRPRKVGRRVRAFGRGLQSRRVAAAVKHFPGLGGADRNSDDGRSYVRRTRWQLHNVDSIPFRKAIAGNLKMMMLSHAVYVNERGSRPASLNHYIATTRVRRKMGFKGVAISDALEAVAWKFNGSVEHACKATVRAGVDIALITGDVYRARSCAATIRNAVRAGEIGRKRLDQAVRRVLRLKESLGLFR